MLGYKNNVNYIGLKKRFDIIFLNHLLKESTFIIYFSSNIISKKDLFLLQNEILKKNLKSCVINSKYLEILFDFNFKIFNSNVIFIFCNNIEDMQYLFNLLKNIKFFYIFNKYFINLFNNNLLLNNNLEFLHYLIFKYTYNIFVIILCYILNILTNIKN